VPSASKFPEDTKMRYQNVQALRGIAASLVVFGHSSAYAVLIIPASLATLGYTGVDIFFVISGFIICRMADRLRAGSQIKTALRFLAKRYWRIFPLYWVVLGFAVGISALGVKTEPSGMGLQPPSNYIFLLTQSNKFVPPAWTLSYELYFYTVFAIIILMAPKRVFFAVTFLMIIQAIVVFFHKSDESIFMSALVLEFGLGCLVAWFDVRGIRRFLIVAALIGASLFVVGDVLAITVEPAGPSNPMRLVTFGLGSAFVLYALVGLEHSGRLILPAWLQKLGDASYSIYLWHWPLIMLSVKLGFGTLGVAAIFGAGLLSYRYVETPLLSVRPGSSRVI
jgi:exopolysaccharide production protein ExoZ